MPQPFWRRSANRKRLSNSEFLDGTIIAANENFLKTVGYRLSEIQGRNHSLFVDEVHLKSTKHRDFRARLSAGEFIAGRV